VILTPLHTDRLDLTPNAGLVSEAGLECSANKRTVPLPRVPYTRERNAPMKQLFVLGIPL